MRLWNAETLELKSESLLNGMNSFSLHDLAFSPDGSRIALGSGEGDVGWLPVAAPAATNLVLHSRARKSPIPHLGWVADVQYSPDGKQMASVSADHQVLVWNTERTNSYRLFRGHEHEVWAALWLPDGNTLVTAGKDETIRLWSLTNRVPSRVLRWRNVQALWNDSEFISVTSHTNEPTRRLALLDWRLRKQTREITLPGLEQASGYFFHPPGGLVGFWQHERGSRDLRYSRRAT
ncbi:MAG: hypothetical protein HC814_03590 [Rhodobacteraceae bacterium]|nr:hypothetical protein [Paracoccaceae bacterium]